MKNIMRLAKYMYPIHPSIIIIIIIIIIVIIIIIIIITWHLNITEWIRCTQHSVLFLQ